MTGYLIYDSVEAVKNQAFIRLFHEEGQAQGISFSYVSKKEYRDRILPELVLNRTRDLQVSRWYEERGVPVFHTSFLTGLGNHKFKTLQYLEKHLPQRILSEKWAPESYLILPDKLAEWERVAARRDCAGLLEAAAFWDRDGVCILKTADGHGGSEVTELLKPEAGAVAAWEQLEEKLRIFRGRECVLQEKIPSESKDVRIYILGNQIYECMLRQGTTDFRSNYSLGGTAEPYVLSQWERERVEAFLEAFSDELLGLAGLDFIIDRQGRLIFNELEEMVGCRMLYRYSNRNPVADYVRWLRQKGVTVFEQTRQGIPEKGKTQQKF